VVTPILEGLDPCHPHQHAHAHPTLRSEEPPKRAGLRLSCTGRPALQQEPGELGFVVQVAYLRPLAVGLSRLHGRDRRTGTEEAGELVVDADVRFSLRPPVQDAARISAGRS